MQSYGETGRQHVSAGVKDVYLIAIEGLFTSVFKFFLIVFLS